MSWHNLMDIFQITFISTSFALFLPESYLPRNLSAWIDFFFRVLCLEFFRLNFISHLFPMHSLCPPVLFLFPLRWLLHPWYVLTKMSFLLCPSVSNWVSSFQAGINWLYFVNAIITCYLQQPSFKAIMRIPNFYFSVWYKQEDLSRTAIPFSILFKGTLVFINFLLRVFITFSAHAVDLWVSQSVQINVLNQILSLRLGNYLLYSNT